MKKLNLGAENKRTGKGSQSGAANIELAKYLCRRANLFHQYPPLTKTEHELKIIKIELTLVMDLRGIWYIVNLLLV